VTDARHWRVASADRRIAIPLDSLTALFDRASGQTHLLAGPLPEILDALGDGPLDTAALLGRLSAAFDVNAVDGDSMSALTARLEELAALGLVHAL
jgi:PqqD family protein of HPr-rel-A system